MLQSQDLEYLVLSVFYTTRGIGEGSGFKEVTGYAVANEMMGRAMKIVKILQ